MTDSLVVNPASGRTYRHEQLLSCLMEWLTEYKIRWAMVQYGLATRRQIKRLAEMVEDSAFSEGGMTEKAVEVAVRQFLLNRHVRRVVARYVSSAHQMPLKQAVRDVWSIRREVSA